MWWNPIVLHKVHLKMKLFIFGLAKFALAIVALG